MTRKIKKVREIEFAKATAKFLEEGWEVMAAKDEEDWPDLIVKIKSKKFGLEVREIYADESRKGSVRKGYEQGNRKFIKELADAYYKSSRSSIEVRISGDLSSDKKLLSAITEIVPQLRQGECIEIEAYKGCVVYIRRLPEKYGEYKRWSYLSDKLGWVGWFDISNIDEFIKRKAEKLPKYKKNISDVRLLLVSYRVSNSGKGDVENSYKCNAHGFNAVYYLSYPIRARELNC